MLTNYTYALTTLFVRVGVWCLVFAVFFVCRLGFCWLLWVFVGFCGFCGLLWAFVGTHKNPQKPTKAHKSPQSPQKPTKTHKSQQKPIQPRQKNRKHPHAQKVIVKAYVVISKHNVHRPLLNMMVGRLFSLLCPRMRGGT